MDFKKACSRQCSSDSFQKELASPSQNDDTKIVEDDSELEGDDFIYDDVEDEPTGDYETTTKDPYQKKRLLRRNRHHFLKQNCFLDTNLDTLLDLHDNLQHLYEEFGFLNQSKSSAFISEIMLSLILK